MPTLNLTDEQVVDLVKQLPAAQQEAVLSYLLTSQWDAWATLSRQCAAGVKTAAAARGQDWTTLDDAAREALIDDLVHEDHRCS